MDMDVNEREAHVVDSNDYRVDLAVFQGPLDLLLYLIRKEEVDIYDIPIARITKQYLKYIELMQVLNLEIAGEFILMAATLIRIKTRMLLPRDESDDEDVDPREELVLALIEYKKYREAGEMLRERALLEQRRFIPPSPLEEVPSRVDLSPATTLYDLMMAFRDVLAQKRDEAIHEVHVEEVSIEDRIQYVIGYLKERDVVSFTELFADVPRKIVAIVTFVALLELVRAHRVSVRQSTPFAELRVYRGERYDAPPSSIDLVTAVRVTPQAQSA
jgi:segregation and condensation protein A